MEAAYYDPYLGFLDCRVTSSGGSNYYGSKGGSKMMNVVDEWVKQRTFTQETAVHTRCETKSQS